MNVDDMGAFEIYLPKDFNHNKFLEDAQSGAGRFWVLCTEDQPDFKRFHGILIAEDQSWLNINIDLGTDYAYTNPRHGQTLSRLEIAKEVKSVLGGLSLYKDGEEIV